MKNSKLEYNITKFNLIANFCGKRQYEFAFIQSNSETGVGDRGLYYSQNYMHDDGH